MESRNNPIRSIAWGEIFPWTILFRTIPIAGSLTVLILSLAGTVATPAGWMMSELIFVRQEMLDGDREFARVVRQNRSPYAAIFSATRDPDQYVELFGARLSGPRAVFKRLTDPFAQLFRRDLGIRFWYFLAGCLWTLAVWAIVGCGITRVCLLRLTRDESAGLDDAWDFAIPRFGHCLWAIGLPLAGVFALVIPAMLLGFLMSFDAGLMLFGLLWFLALICGLLMTLLLLGSFFSWPLVIASISAESQNPLDAITRCFSYVFQRPFHYGFYLVASILLGGVCWLVVSQIAYGTVTMASWAGSWGANIGDGNRMQDIIEEASSSSSISDELTLNVPVMNFASGGIGQRATEQVTSPSQTPPQLIQGRSSEQARNPNEAGEPAATTEDSPDPDSNRDVTTIVQPVQSELRIASPDKSTMFWWGSRMVQFWNGLVYSLAVAFLYGLFWCMASGIYLLLRYDVDEVEMDEIFIDEESRSYDIAKMQTDANGVPQIQPLDDVRNTGRDGD